MKHAVFLLGLISAALSGRLPAQPSPEQREAILGFKLTTPRANHLITAMSAMTTYVTSLPDFAERMAKMRKMTPAERLAAMEKDPKTAAILKDNELTAKEYVVGVPALRMALMIASGGEAGPTVFASPDNIAFAKANLAQLKPRMDAADGLRPKPQ